MDVVMVVTGVLLHAALGRWIASPWLVPDVTLIALVMALSRCGASASFRPLIVVSLLVMSLTVRHPLQAACGYLGVGWLITIFLSRFDVSGRLLPVVAIGSAEALLLAIWLVVIGPSPRNPLVAAGVRWLLTCAGGLLVLLLRRRVAG